MSKEKKVSSEEKIKAAKICASWEISQTKAAQRWCVDESVMIDEYIAYSSNHRVQRSLGVLTPTEKHYSNSLAA